MNPFMKVAVLCAAPNSSYYDIEGVEVYDKRRDAHTFPGGMPVVAHPPCRAWSAFLSHQAKPEKGEKELGIWCTEQLRRWGGVLEHPARSRLFTAAGLPLPGERKGDLWTMYVQQSWWGYPHTKHTWLCFSNVAPERVKPPLRLHDNSNDNRLYHNMSKHRRSATMPALSQWLVNAARTVGKE